ncbi:hypothetical protein HK104_007047, partial [Borealophlyctis nickersoniae]
MEGFRITHGLPMVVTGNFGGRRVNEAIRQVLRETGLWRNYFAPSTTAATNAVWIPHLPPHNTGSTAIETAVQPVTSRRTCLYPSDGQCADVAEYAAWFRRQVGGMLADEYIPVKHEACAADWGTELPITYTVENGNLTLRVVTYNLGSLSPDRLTDFHASRIPTYLSTFDVVLLQMRNLDYTQGPILPSPDFHHTVAPNLHIYYTKNVTADCTSERYTPTRHILGCLFRTNTTQVIIATLQESLASPLTSPGADLPDADVGVMKRVYAKLCVGSRGVEECGEYPVPAVFAGTWNAGGVRFNMTFGEVRRRGEEVEKEIIRKNQIGDATFADGRVRVEVIVPTEQSEATDGDASPALVKQTGGSAFGNVLGWLTGSGKQIKRQWPYWTHVSGTLTSYAVIFTSTNVPVIKNAVIDPFLGSPVCVENSTAVHCAGTGIPCVTSAMPVAARF